MLEFPQLRVTNCEASSQSFRGCASYNTQAPALKAALPKSSAILCLLVHVDTQLSQVSDDDWHVFLFDHFLLRVAIVPCLHSNKSVHPGATGKGTPELCGVSGQEWEEMRETLHTLNLKSCRKGRHHQQYPGKGTINADFTAILLFIFERLFECRFFNQVETIFCKALGGATGSSMSCTRCNCFPKLRLTRNSETMFIFEVDIRLTSWAKLFRAQVATLQDPRCFMPAWSDLQVFLPICSSRCSLTS